MITEDLQRAGLVLNQKKSHLTPARVGKWLGVNIDLVEGMFSIPTERIDKLKSRLASLLSGSTATARALAKVTGLVMSMRIAIGPVARLRTRALYQMVNSRLFWNEKLCLTLEAREELGFWLESVEALNGRAFRWTPSATRVVFSDASDTGYGGYVVQLGPHETTGIWSEDEAKQSSTWRELKAVDRVLESLACKLEGQTVKWCTDNQNVVRIVQYGSRKPHLQDGAMCIYERCLQLNIRLEMSWIPRAENEKADYLSRIIDHDDWQVSPSLFDWLNWMWGPFTVDNFADCDNTQLERFHSRFWSPGTYAVDTFTTSWREEMNWLVPPVDLIGRTIRHAMVCQARGCLLVPVWESAYFWPLLVPDGIHLAGFVHAWCYLPYQKGMLISGRSGSNISSTMNSDSCLLALFIDFSMPPRQHVEHPAFSIS